MKLNATQFRSFSAAPQLTYVKRKSTGFNSDCCKSNQSRKNPLNGKVYILRHKKNRSLLDGALPLKHGHCLLQYITQESRHCAE